MRCYFMRAGRIVSVEELPGLSDQEAIKTSCRLFDVGKADFDGFEIWDRARIVFRASPSKSDGAPRPPDDVT